MKPIVTLVAALLLCLPTHRAAAQAEELEQLALDTKKLIQMKALLQQMYEGYKIITGGYQTVRDLAKGNFNLHAAFLNGLLQISPGVRQYALITQIIADQITLVKEYKSAYQQFQQVRVFSASELQYIQSVFSNVVAHSIDDLDELTMIITQHQLRMNDAERLAAIDQVYTHMHDKIGFLRQFNATTRTVATQRLHQQQEYPSLQRLFGQ